LKRRQAEPLTLEEEELLREMGLLGSGTPQSLVDMMHCINGLYFALRSGAEHRQLRHDPYQIMLVERCGERAYLKYTEYVSKNKPGGLKDRKTKPKAVLHHANEQDPEQCFVDLSSFTIASVHKIDPRVFYLQPLVKPSPGCWFSNTYKPIGHNKLDGTVARLCKNACIPGYRMNHYHSNQVIPSWSGRTAGHGAFWTPMLGSYKRTSSDQQESMSDILNETSTQLSTSNANSVDSDSSEGGTVQMTNIAHTSNSLTNVIHPLAFNLHSCAVTINYINQPPQ
jgi:hypothetical protein